MSTINVDIFISQLERNEWIINGKKIIPSDYVLNAEALLKIEKAPSNFKKFICSFTSCANKQDTIWFLSYADYIDDEDIDFPWNEFEKQSLEAADEDEELMEEISLFWKKQIPFLISVRDSYSYISLCIEDDNYGKIYYGCEPEYEESILIANSLEEFFSNYIDAINGIFATQEYRLLLG